MKSTFTHVVFSAEVPSDFPPKSFLKYARIVLFWCTSSNFCAIMAKALKIASVAPVMVTILSGDDPSDMLIRAPLWKYKYTIISFPIFRKMADDDV